MPSSDARVHILPQRPFLLAGALFLLVFVVLLCLVPKFENDLFFVLRIGEDILRTGQLPHHDTYSWTNRGTRWDLPEWLAFVLYTLAFRGGGFFGTWLLMTCLTLATAGIVWAWLLRHTSFARALALTCLMLLGLSATLQERPYAFTYLFLAVSLILVMRARRSGGRIRQALWLLPLCALWTNLHQGFVSLIGLVFLFGVGDFGTALWLWGRDAGATPPDLLSVTPDQWDRQRGETIRQRRSLLRRAGFWFALAAGCAAMGMLSPYGARVYQNIWITLHSPTLMDNVTEWNPATRLPLFQLQPFLLMAAFSFGTLIFSKTRSLGEFLALTALLIDAELYARNIALFVIGAAVIAAPHIDNALWNLRRRLRLSLHPPAYPVPLLLLAVLCLGALCLQCILRLRQAHAPQGFSLASVGEAVARVPSYPSRACAFMDAEQFPDKLRIFNNFEIGGYLMWRLPREPVFVDGRLDVYVGRTFDSMLMLSRPQDTSAWRTLVRQYDLECAITTSERIAHAFAQDPGWQLVYQDAPGPGSQHCRIFLRHSATQDELIRRCLRDRPLLKAPSPSGV